MKLCPLLLTFLLLHAAALAGGIHLPDIFTEEGGEAPDLPSPDGKIELSLLLAEKGGKPLANTHASIFLSSPEAGERTLLRYTAESGIVPLYLSPGKWLVQATADLPETPQADYTSLPAEIDVAEKASMALEMEPVGDLKAIATGFEGDASGVQLACSCARNFSMVEAGPGYLLVRHLPVGECLVQASSGDLEGSIAVTIGQGQVPEAELSLKRRSRRSYIYGLAAACILAIVVLWNIIHPKVKKLKPPAPQEPPDVFPPKKAAAAPKEIAPTEKMKNVLTTLEARERQIVELLLENCGVLLQSRIYRLTGIPKTSLIRRINSLQKRNIVQTQKLGKTLRVELTDWLYPDYLKRNKVRVRKAEAAGIKPTQKMLDKMSRLNEGEQRIVRLLLESEGRLTQSKIHSLLKIPKTSLIRKVKSLQARGIVSLSAFGKTKMVELARGFLE